MHIQAEPVAGAVHVQMAVGPLFNQTVHITEQEAEVHQTLHQHPQGGVMHLLRRRARLHHSHGRLLGGEHQAVQLPLLR